MKTVMTFALLFLITSCKVVKTITHKQVPAYYKIESPSGEVFEARAIFQDCAIDMATGRSTILLNESYKIIPVYAYSKSN